MKRVAAVAISAAMLLSVTACGGQGAEGAVPAAGMAAESGSAGQEAAPPEASEPAGYEVPEQSRPETALAPEPADPYGLGVDPADINWDAVVYDLSGDMLEDGWPSIYLNLAQVVSLEYEMWSECGWHKHSDGAEDTFHGVLAEAGLANKETWQSFGSSYSTEVYGLMGPKAEAPFSVDEEAGCLLLLLDALSMEQLAALLEEPALQPYLLDGYNTSHSGAVAGWMLAHPDQPEEAELSEADKYRQYVENRTEEILAEEAAARGIDVELCRELNAVADPVIIEGLERGDDHDTIQAAVDEAINAYWWWKELEAWAQTADQDMAESAQAAEAYNGQASVDEEAHAAENDLTMEQYYVVAPIIQSIAADAMGTGSTDLEHVRAASKAIYNDYVVNAVYGDEGDSYNSP